MANLHAHQTGTFLLRRSLLLLAGWLWSIAAAAQFPIGGGGSNPCSAATPEITVRNGCGGVVTLTLSPVNRNASYSWNLGNGSTATGPGPITAAYTGTGPYTVTVTLTIASGNTACQASTSETVTPNQSGGCCPAVVAAANLLGAAGTTTILSGNHSFSNDKWRVLGDLILTKGNYTLSNATFYVDGTATKTPASGGGYQRTVSGATITLGVDATLTLDNSTLTASGSSVNCPMWRGLVLNNNGSQGPSGKYRLIMQNNSAISHALYGIETYDQYGGAGMGTTEYTITNSAFANNLTHIYDHTAHLGPNLSVIANSTFSCDTTQMHFPYNQTSLTDKSFTYQALLLTPRDNNNNFNYVLDVHDNTISHAVYGIVNNMEDNAEVQIHDNQLVDIYAKGIWTVDKVALPTPPATTAVISGNRVMLNTSLTQPTEQVDPQATSYGFYTEGRLHNYSNSFKQNYVRSDGVHVNLRTLIGMGLNGVVDVTGNYLANLTQAIRSTAQDGALFDNYIAACDKGLVIPQSGSSSYQTTLGCNTFYGGHGNGTTPTGPGVIQTAIEVESGGYLNNQGSPSSPVANNFDGYINTAISNNGPQFDYWYASSPQEALVASPVAVIGSNPVAVMPVAAPLGGWTSYCSNQGATNGNGVNARGSLPSAATVAALADSVRLRLVPITRRRAYLYTVLNYYQDQNQLGALETWWGTLLLPNTEDYRTTGLALLNAYDHQPAPAAAQRVLALLQPQALLNAEVAAALQYRLVWQHLPQTTPKLAAADSTVLRALAWSGTSLAERAAQWLHYFYPRLRLPALPTQPANRSTRVKAAAVGAVLGVAYPNPTPATARVPYQLPVGAAAAELQVTNLLTGRVQLTLPLETGGNTIESQSVQLPQLPAGQYMYRLLVDGQPVAVPQRLVIR